MNAHETSQSDPLPAAHRPSVGFIGAGRIARIMIDGWARAGFEPAALTAFDPDGAAIERLTSTRPHVTAGSVAEAAAADIVFVGVHPPLAAEVFERLRPLLGSRTVLVSLVPGTRLDRLSDLLGTHGSIARVIPNAPSIVGAGFNPVAFGPTMSESDKQAICSVLDPLGDHPIVEERDLEAYAILTAMGPTYVWPQLYALTRLATGWGMTDEQVSTALGAMLLGATATMAHSDLDESGVVDLVPSKPMAEAVAAVTAAYPATLGPLHDRLAGKS